MKVKVDYVTNSSSEIFGVVIGDSILAGLFLGLFSVLSNGCKSKQENLDPVTNQTDGILEEAASMANQIASAAVEDAIRQENIIKDAYEEAGNALDSAKKALEKELEECKKAWEESDITADKTDPGYNKLKKQYEDYEDYLNSQIQQTDYKKQMIDFEKAQKQAEMDSKNDWVKQQQADYIALKEEKAMLQAVAKGYNVSGYNTDAVKSRINQLNEREKELSDILNKNNASIDYTARDRGEIGPSKESKELNDKIIAEKDKYEKEKTEADKKKREKLEKEMQKNIKEYNDQIKKANVFDMATKAAEGVQFGADIAVEGLSYVTGPAGQKVKLAYTAGKNIASGMGEGMADPKNASKHLAKGLLNAGTEILKDKFSDGKPWQAAATEILNEGLQSGLDASIEGKDIVEEMGKGLTKGVFSAGTDKALDMIKDKLPIPKGSSVDVSDFSTSQILNNNPLAKGLVKTTVREGTGAKIKDAIKNSVVDEAGKKGGFVDPE